VLILEWRHPVQYKIRINGRIIAISFARSFGFVTSPSHFGLAGTESWCDHGTGIEPEISGGEVTNCLRYPAVR